MTPRGGSKWGVRDGELDLTRYVTVKDLERGRSVGSGKDGGVDSH